MAASKTAVRGTAGADKLDTFVWKGTDKRGVVMKGEQTGKSLNLVKAELRKQGINPTDVKMKRKSMFGNKGGKAIKPLDIAIFSRMWATMMKSGVPIVQSLEIIGSGQKNPRMATMVNQVRDDISGGNSLYDSLSKHPVQFDELYRNLVRAGESAGVLETVLETIASYKENIEAIKGKIKKALFYPAMIIVVAILVSAVLLIFVVPQFEEVFKGFGAELPAFTKMIVAASKFLVAYWWIMLLIAVAAIAGFIFAYKRSVPMQHAIDRISLRLPIIGKILNDSAVARFSRTLAVTFAAGVPLVEALDSVAGATGNSVYTEAVHRIREDVAVGYNVNTAMKQTNLFPHMVVQMTAIGEEAGALDTMLFKVAEFYEQEVNNAVDALASLIEPFVMVIIGVLVGSMVIGMYLPIFKLASVVG
ncbi:type II secretion system F family protein [Lysobacter sp. HDW10]|uniref:type II secretion system F family protein n=1 Tax=Lysobacter sp. HDW10 TaxID=2714936 RepID=UPI0014091D9C|nr:type II secretion system F family protein [Lysobacter sp. HDW10]QIK80348.1 type II secretion system F family protein [Lysobacter sp. HDW10]